MSKSIGNVIVPSLITHGGEVSGKKVKTDHRYVSLRSIRTRTNIRLMERTFCECGWQTVNTQGTLP